MGSNRRSNALSSVDVRDRATIVVEPTPEKSIEELAREIALIQADLDHKISSSGFDFMIKRNKQRSVKQLLDIAMRNL